MRSERRSRAGRGARSRAAVVLHRRSQRHRVCRVRDVHRGRGRDIGRRHKRRSTETASYGRCRLMIGSRAWPPHHSTSTLIMSSPASIPSGASTPEPEPVNSVEVGGEEKAEEKGKGVACLELGNLLWKSNCHRTGRTMCLLLERLFASGG